MLITLSRRTAICQSASEVDLAGVSMPTLGAVNQRIKFLNVAYYYYFLL